MAQNILVYTSAALALVCSVVLAEGQTECGENMHFEKCGTKCPQNCTNIGTAIPCQRRCEAGCFCNSGFVFEDNTSKRCVPEIFCNSCKGNSRYSSCVTQCPPTCDKPSPECSRDKCWTGCVCRDGYVLASASSRECVLLSECSK
ncbi:mucin-5B-like [Lissotriton helveticus]